MTGKGIFYHTKEVGYRTGQQMSYASRQEIDHAEVVQDKKRDMIEGQGGGLRNRLMLQDRR